MVLWQKPSWTSKRPQSRHTREIFACHAKRRDQLQKSLQLHLLIAKECPLRSTKRSPLASPTVEGTSARFDVVRLLLGEGTIGAIKENASCDVLSPSSLGSSLLT